MDSGVAKPLFEITVCVESAFVSADNEGNDHSQVVNKVLITIVRDNGFIMYFFVVYVYKRIVMIDEGQYC